MAVEASGNDLVQVVALLAAGVVAVPIFRRLGLGSVLGYLAAGLVIGPFGLGLFTDPQAILHVAELGVVMFLFVIGLEMQPSRLWSLRREIFGLGVAQVLVCGALLTVAGIACRLAPARRLRRRHGLRAVLDRRRHADADERGETSTPAGQRIVSILLLEDLAIVPLLAVVALLAPGVGGSRCAARAGSRSRIALGRGRGAGRRRPLAAQPDVPAPRRRQGARGDDGGRAAGRARRRARHADRRAVDGDGRLPRRRAAVGIDLPPSARSRHRAVPRHAARPVLPRRRHVARPRA